MQPRQADYEVIMHTQLCTCCIQPFLHLCIASNTQYSGFAMLLIVEPLLILFTQHIAAVDHNTHCQAVNQGISQ